MPDPHPSRKISRRRVPAHAAAALARAPSATLFRHWLALGALLLALLPASSWYHPWVGWLPYWAVVAPALSLLMLHRQRVAAALFAFLVRERRRRLPSARYRGPQPARGARRARAAAAREPLLIRR